ncbi:unnamed protein product [Dibothriocephalus latus]|uniref:Uncharacterized protein n=1 Tax=Dibothriocephalus latus TaxID=60516 RepID=A0A3P6QQT8_DIBLA|nr:unnamed protein product [Dibothriocephalus latus]
MGGVTLLNGSLIGSRLQTSAFFGFWPLIGQIVGDGLSTDRLATLLSPSSVHSDLVTVDNRLDTLASLLLIKSKEILLRRILQSTTHPALFHGPEIRVTRLSTNLSRSDTPHPQSHRNSCEDATDLEPANPLKSVFAQVSRRMLQMDEFGVLCSNEDPDGLVDTGAPVTAEEEVGEANHRQRGARACLANQLTSGRPTLIPRPPRLHVPPQPHFWLSRRAWKVSLVGESVDDCGGGFSDSVAEICDELHAPWSGLPVLVPCSPLIGSFLMMALVWITFINLLVRTLAYSAVCRMFINPTLCFLVETTEPGSLMYDSCSIISQPYPNHRPPSCLTNVPQLARVLMPYQLRFYRLHLDNCFLFMTESLFIFSCL